MIRSAPSSRRRTWSSWGGFDGGAPWRRHTMPRVNDDYALAELNGLKLAWRPELDGGGRRFGRDFVPMVGHLFGRVTRLFEFCAGPGYIGFSLLASGQCDHLVLADVNPRAIDANARDSPAERPRRAGHDLRIGMGLDDIPADERWDLVVANPPHFARQFLSYWQPANGRSRMAAAPPVLSEGRGLPRPWGIAPYSGEQRRQQPRGLPAVHCGGRAGPGVPPCGTAAGGHAPSTSCGSRRRCRDSRSRSALYTPRFPFRGLAHRSADGTGGSALRPTPRERNRTPASAQACESVGHQPAVAAGRDSNRGGGRTSARCAERGRVRGA